MQTICFTIFGYWLVETDLKFDILVCVFIVIGLNFSAFVETFFLLSQRKYPACSDVFERVNQMVDSCLSHLNLSDSDIFILEH